jgi:hypothetical protein
MCGYGRGMSGKVECDDWDIWSESEGKERSLKRMDECNHMISDPGPVSFHSRNTRLRS